MLMGIGTYPATGHALEHGITTGLSVDTGTDLSIEMRVALAAERARTNAEAVARDESPAEVQLDRRDMLRLATLDAAKAWHLDGAVGTLTVGSRRTSSSWTRSGRTCSRSRIPPRRSS